LQSTAAVIEIIFSGRRQANLRRRFYFCKFGLENGGVGVIRCLLGLEEIRDEVQLFEDFYWNIYGLLARPSHLGKHNGLSLIKP
jgi:hypothetical protein